MSQTAVDDRYFQTERVWKILLRIAPPVMLAQLIQALYNLVDSMFVAQLSSDGFVALALVYPIQTLMIAVCVGTGVGFNALLARRLGEDRPDEANRVVANGYFVYLVCWVVFLVLGVGLAPVFMELFAPGQPQVIDYGIQYLSIVTGASVGICMQFAGERTLQATGNTVGPMVIQGIGAVINLILDPLLIFGIGPFPRMEVAGAAAATVLAQAIVTAMFLLAARRETTLFPHIHPFRPSQGRAWLEMLRIGLPVSIQSMFFSSLSMFIARIVAGWGDAAIAAQKVGTQIESISYTTAEGFATAVNAFIAQNFGARRLDRICRGYWTAVGMIVAWSCFTTVMLVVFPAPLVRVFIQKEEVVRTGVSYLRIMGYSQILMCLEITSSGAFQGLGRPMPPTLAGVIGNAARIPMAILLSATVLGLDGVWWSISISSIAKGLVVFAWFVVVLHRCTRDGDLGVPRFIR